MRPGRASRLGLGYRVRIIRVFARTEFKLKYADSVLGYFWSLAKPLIYFATLWVVFSRIFHTGIPKFGLYLIIGVVLFTYMSDAVSACLPSIVSRGTVLRRISFPSIAIPLGSLASSTMTFALNLVVVGVFVAVAGIAPTGEWVLIVPLLLEFVVFVLGFALIVSSLYVRFRDVGQIWDVLATVMLYTSAIMYPMAILPSWLQSIVGVNPLVQVTQGVRRIVFAHDAATKAQVTLPQPAVYGVLIAFALLAVGYWLHRREAPRFPEVA